MTDKCCEKAAKCLDRLTLKQLKTLGDAAGLLKDKYNTKPMYVDAIVSILSHGGHYRKRHNPFKCKRSLKSRESFA